MSIVQSEQSQLVTQLQQDKAIFAYIRIIADIKESPYVLSRNDKVDIFINRARLAGLDKEPLYFYQELSSIRNNKYNFDNFLSRRQIFITDSKICNFIIEYDHEFIIKQIK